MGKTDGAIARLLEQAHLAIVADLRNLEQAIGPYSGKGLVDLLAQLLSTEAHLAEHFRFEEQNGYMEAVKKREPRLARTIDQLSQEHGELSRRIGSLIRKATATASLDDGLRAGIREWIEHVRRHEARETEVIQDAYQLDLGAED